MENKELGLDKVGETLIQIFRQKFGFKPKSYRIMSYFLTNSSEQNID